MFSTPRNRWITPFALSATLSFAPLSGCGADKTAPDISMAADTAPDAVVPKASRLPEATAFFSGQLDATRIPELLSLAEALSSESSSDAKVAAARLRLLAVALATRDELGEGGAEKQLSLASSLLDTVGATAPKEASLVVSAMRAMRMGERESWPAPEALHPILSGNTPESIALRLTTLTAHARALKAASTEGFGEFLRALGPMLCKDCHEGASEAALKNGLACSAPKAPYCATLDAARAALPLAALGPNAAAVAALGLVHTAGTLQAPLTALVSPPSRVILPVPTDGADTSIDAGPLAAKGHPLAVLDLGPTGLRLGLRPIIDLTGRDTAPEALSASAPIAQDALIAAEPDKDTGAIAGITDRVATLFDRASTEASSQPETTPALLISLSPAWSSPALVAKVLDALGAAKDKAFSARFLLRGGTTGDVLPAHLRDLPPELERRLSPAWERPIIVVVGPEALDIWAPEGKRDGGTELGPDLRAKVPGSLEQGWRGERLARLRIPLPPMQAAVERLGHSQLVALGEAVGFFVAQAGAGRVLHVVADEGATTSDMLRVGRQLSEALSLPEAGPDLPPTEDIWALSHCRTPNCARAVPVLFSRLTPPNPRGLTPEPTKAEKAQAKPPEAKHQPSSEYCNQADIRSQMLKRAGSFRFCYERELQLSKDLEGRVAMGFVIALDGSVKNVRTASNGLGNDKVPECIAREIGKLKFKPPEGGECVVQWPFVFKAN